ncbi:MAG: hypothetical protein ACKOB6_10160 [Candidatus Kapaibacterium sp.]
MKKTNGYVPLRSGSMLLLLTSALLACLLLMSCETPKPAMKERLPYGSAGARVNTAFDEIAPQLVGGTSALLFTRDSVRDAANELSRRQRLFLSGRAANGWDSARSTADDAWMAYDNSVGATVSDSSAPLFFSATHIPSTSGTPDSTGRRFLRGGCGGADLVASVIDTGDIRIGLNLGDSVNSRYWDAHPALAFKGPDSVLLVFASDRPVIEGARTFHAHGFSMPFINQEYDLSFENDPVRNGRRVRKGNADLYYAFRIHGKWSPVRNMNDVRGLRDSINSEDNEYSPFVYCPSGNPVLYFSSQGHQDDSTAAGTGDIFSACLDVDYRMQLLIVRTFNRLPLGSDSVNTRRSDERFPYVYEDGTKPWIAFSSDRDTDGVRVVSASIPETPQRIVSRGGYDIYQMPLSGVPCPCAAPPPVAVREPEGQVYYDVVILDRTKPSRIVRQASILVIDSGNASAVPVRDGRVRIAMQDGHRYAAYGASSFTASCEGAANSDVIGYQGYARDIAVRHVPVRALTYDTIRIDADTIRETVTVYDTLRLDAPPPAPVPQASTAPPALTELAENPKKDTVVKETDERPVLVRRDRCTTVITLPKKVTERTIGMKEKSSAMKTRMSAGSGGKSAVKETVPVPVAESITLASDIAIRKRDIVRLRVEGGSTVVKVDTVTVDSSYMESTYRMVGLDTAMGASVRTLKDGIPDAGSLRATGKASVVYDTIYVEPILAVKCPPIELIATTNLFGIPYYQTCYWKVNTVKGLEQVLTDMRSGQGWQGTTRRFVELHGNNKYWGRNDSILRERRIEMFRFFAVQVDRIFDSLAEKVENSLVVFMANKKAMKDTTHRRKFVIDLTAWSDKRAIEVARYFDPDVRFMADYSQGLGAQRCLASSLRKVEVVQNADLSGEDNTRLSNLRAYYSYVDFLERLRRLPTFARVLRSGHVALPDATDTLSSYVRMLDTCDVLFLIRGSSVYAKSRDTVISEDHRRKREELADRVSAIPASQMSSGTRKRDLDEALRLDFNRWDSIVVSTYDFSNSCLIPEKPCVCSGYVDRSQALFGLRPEADKRKQRQPARRRNGTD